MHNKEESQESFARQLGRAVMQNNHLRRELRRFLREKHLEKVINGGQHESRNNDKCNDLDVDICQRLQCKNRR